MKHLKNYNQFINEKFLSSHLNKYFHDILNIYYPNIDEDFILDNMVEIENRLIIRAKENLDSRPSESKISEWKSIIADVLSYTINGPEPEPVDYSAENLKKTLHDDKSLDYIFGRNGMMRDILDEVGYDKTFFFVKKELDSYINTPSTSTNINLSKLANDKIDTFPLMFDKHSKPIEYDENDDIRDKKMKNALIYIFIMRLKSNVPSDISMEDAEIYPFVKKYAYSFIYEYLIKMANLYK